MYWIKCLNMYYISMLIKTETFYYTFFLSSFLFIKDLDVNFYFLDNFFYTISDFVIFHDKFNTFNIPVIIRHILHL